MPRWPVKARRKRCPGCGWLMKDCGCNDPAPDVEAVFTATDRLRKMARWAVQDREKISRGCVRPSRKPGYTI